MIFVLVCFRALKKKIENSPHTARSRSLPYNNIHYKTFAIERSRYITLIAKFVNDKLKKLIIICTTVFQTSVILFNFISFGKSWLENTTNAIARNPHQKACAAFPINQNGSFKLLFTGNHITR